MADMRKDSVVTTSDTEQEPGHKKTNLTGLSSLLAQDAPRDDARRDDSSDVSVQVAELEANTQEFRAQEALDHKTRSTLKAGGLPITETQRNKGTWEHDQPEVKGARPSGTTWSRPAPSAGKNDAEQTADGDMIEEERAAEHSTTRDDGVEVWDTMAFKSGDNDSGEEGGALPLVDQPGVAAGGHPANSSPTGPPTASAPITGDPPRVSVEHRIQLFLHVDGASQILTKNGFVDDWKANTLQETTDRPRPHSSPPVMSTPESDSDGFREIFEQVGVLCPPPGPGFLARSTINLRDILGVDRSEATLVLNRGKQVVRAMKMRNAAFREQRGGKELKLDENKSRAFPICRHDLHGRCHDRSHSRCGFIHKKAVAWTPEDQLDQAMPYPELDRDILNVLRVIDDPNRDRLHKIAGDIKKLFPGSVTLPASWTEVAKALTLELPPYGDAARIEAFLKSAERLIGALLVAHKRFEVGGKAQ